MAFDPYGGNTIAAHSYVGRRTNLLAPKRAAGLLVPPELQALELFRGYPGFLKYNIFPQVHLLQAFHIDKKAVAELLKKNSVIAKQRTGASAAISKSWLFSLGWRSVDFLFCELATSVIVGGVEIDDDSHAREDRQASDHIKNVIFASLNLPLLRMTNAQVEEIASRPSATRNNALSVVLKGSRDAWTKVAAGI